MARANGHEPLSELEAQGPHGVISVWAPALGSWVSPQPMLVRYRADVVNWFRVWFLSPFGPNLHTEYTMGCGVGGWLYSSWISSGFCLDLILSVAIAESIHILHSRLRAPSQLNCLQWTLLCQSLFLIAISRHESAHYLMARHQTSVH